MFFAADDNEVARRVFRITQLRTPYKYCCMLLSCLRYFKLLLIQDAIALVIRSLSSIVVGEESDFENGYYLLYIYKDYKSNNILVNVL